MPKERVVNYVKGVYEPFTDEEISDRIARMITPSDCPSPVEVICQTIENLHRACPDHTGGLVFFGQLSDAGRQPASESGFYRLVRRSGSGR